MFLLDVRALSARNTIVKIKRKVFVGIQTLPNFADQNGMSATAGRVSCGLKGVLPAALMVLKNDNKQLN